MEFSQPANAANAPSSGGGQKKVFTVITLVVLIAVIAFVYVWYSGNNREAAISTLDYNGIFDLEYKEVTTRIYISDNLGLGFTYKPSPAEGAFVNVSETEDEVSVDGQTVTVFSKPAGQSLEEAIRQKFLSDVSAEDCFVSDFNTGDSYPGYVSSAISFPLAEVPGASFFVIDEWIKSAAKCPRRYSLGNGDAFFLMNPLVPNKFVFVQEGWNYSATSDGTMFFEGEKAPNWTRSLRILW